MVTFYTSNPEILEPLPLFHPLILVLRIKLSSNLATKLYFNSLESTSVLSFTESRNFYHYYSTYTNAVWWNIHLVVTKHGVYNKYQGHLQIYFTFLCCKGQLTALVHKIIRDMNKIVFEKLFKYLFIITSSVLCVTSTPHWV